MCSLHEVRKLEAVAGLGACPLMFASVQGNTLLCMKLEFVTAAACATKYSCRHYIRTCVYIYMYIYIYKKHICSLSSDACVNIQ
jgi:hypothetical protein